MASSDIEPRFSMGSSDRQALIAMLEEAGPVVRKRLHGSIPDRWRSVLSLDDVMQQTYTDAFLDIGQFVPEGPNSFTAWLTSLARNNLVDTLRMLEAEKRGVRFNRVEVQTRDESFRALCDLLEGSITSPSRRLAREEAHAALARAIELLPERYRHVVRRYDLEGESVETVAAELGRSPGAVYMIRARAHRRLCELMGGNPGGTAA